VVCRASKQKGLIVKGHIVEKHLVNYARYYGTLGVFGEDGLEALHPSDTRSRVVVRAMRNSEARHRALMKINLMKQFYGNAASDGSCFEAKRQRASKANMAERRRSLEAAEPGPEPEPGRVAAEPLELPAAGEEPEDQEEEDGEL
jgi:hypothetical protein